MCELSLILGVGLMVCMFCNLLVLEIFALNKIGSHDILRYFITTFRTIESAAGWLHTKLTYIYFFNKTACYHDFPIR